MLQAYSNQCAFYSLQANIITVFVSGLTEYKLKPRYNVYKKLADILKIERACHKRMNLRTMSLNYIV